MPKHPEGAEMELFFCLGNRLSRSVSTGGYYGMRIAHTHADRLLAVVSQGGGSRRMFAPEWIEAQNQMEYPYASV